MSLLTESQAPLCPLCKSADTSEFAALSSTRIFYLCARCELRFLRPDLRLNPAAEKARYDKHQNNVEDKNYQNFVAPLIEAVVEIVPSSARGLDFGCGPSSVASHLLRKREFTMDLYDTFFQPSLADLKDSYDFIICSEVMEHFSDPHKEIGFLKKKLTKGGILFAMTQLWQNNMPFENWYYHRDPTHICFYSGPTLRWIQHEWAFKGLQIRGKNVVILTV